MQIHVRHIPMCASSPLNRLAAQRSDPRRNTPCGGDVIPRGLVGPTSERPCLHSRAATILCTCHASGGPLRRAPLIGLGRPIRASSVFHSGSSCAGALCMCWGRRPQLPKCWRRAASCAAGRVVPGTGPGPVHVLGSAPPAAHVLASRRQLRGRERPSMAGSILSWAGPSGRAPCILCSQHAGVGTDCSPTAAALLLQLCSCSVEEQVIHVSNQLHWQWTPVIQS